MRALILCAVLLAGASAEAAEPAARPETRLVSVELKDKPLRDAVEQVFSGSGLVKKVEANVPNVAVSLSIKDVPLDTAARLVLHVAGVSVPQLQLSRAGEGYVYQVGEGLNPDPTLRPEKDPRLDPRVSVSLPQATLREALAATLGKAGVPYLVLPNVPNFNLRLVTQELTLRETLAKLMEQAHVIAPSLYLGQEGPVYLVGFSRAALAQLPRTQGTFAGGRAGNLNIRDVGLRACLRIMARETEYTIEVDPKLPDPKLTVNFRQVTLEEALRGLVGELKRLGITAKLTRKGDSFYLEPGGEEV